MASSLDLQGAYAHLARHGVAGHGLEDTLRQLTESTGRMLNVERVGLWGLRDDRQALECIDLYERSRDRHSHGMQLLASRYPVYFQALHAGEPIIADDALKHPDTHEFAPDYLPRHGISAKIDSPIHVSGELQGVLCIEQVGPHSAWSSVQRLFSHAVASLVTLALVQHQAGQLRGELGDANARLQALFNGAREAIVIVDPARGRVLDANPQAEKLFGRPRERLLGMSLDELHPAGENARCRALFARQTPGDGAPLRCAAVDAAGTRIPVEVSVSVVTLGGGRRLVQGVFRPLAEPL